VRAVIKISGALAASAAICADVAALRAAGEQVILVHGGAAQIDRLTAELGITGRWTTSPSGVTTRHTDDTMLDVVLTALLGRVRPAVLTALADAGIRAVGLSGLDAGLLRARRRAAVRAVVDGRTLVLRDDRSGVVDQVEAGLLLGLLELGVVPVVSPPAMAEDGKPVNVNADRVAAAVALAVGADRLLFLTGQPGVLRDLADPDTVIDEYELPEHGETPASVSDGMVVKLIAAGEAVDGGIGDVRIAGAARPHPVLDALSGAAGTMLRRPAAAPRPPARAPAGVPSGPSRSRPPGSSG
jgi:[amino group carrier protein]-L-2-aminoadipate/L-glutamate 6-kinase